MVVLISGLSLLSYAVPRIVGQEKGTPLLGDPRGLVSSTATTPASCAGHQRRHRRRRAAGWRCP